MQLVKDDKSYLSPSVYSGEIQPIKSQKRVQSPTSLIVAWWRDDGVEVVVVAAPPIAGVADDEGSAACGCKDGWVTLCLVGCELPAVAFFDCSCIFCFCFANATPLAEAFLYVILGGIKLRRRTTYRFAPRTWDLDNFWAMPTQFGAFITSSMPFQKVPNPVKRI
jgi:hypothetical protein